MALLTFLFLWMAPVWAQDGLVTVTGSVTDTTGEPLIGATVAVKGTSVGTATDIDGNYSLNVREGATLLFSYIGYRPIEETVGSNHRIDIVMYEDTETLDEVVVTALGIKREQKSLSYNVQQIKGDDLSDNKDANFINGLAGKVAGVNINASSSGVGGISKVQMRGTKSIMQSSNALYVVDGMPMRSANNGGSTEFGSQGATEPIADLNPEDIESMSVLTGAAAAALYGSEAANGAIVITTKKGQAGKTKVTVNSSLQWDRALIMHRLQNRYGTGTNGAYVPTSNMSWGAPLSAYNSYNYQPANDYFQTGFVSTQSATFSTGTEKNQTYASIAAVNSLGITPNNRYDRYNFNVRNTSTFLNDKLTLDLNAGYIRQSDRNMVNQGTYGNPLVGALLYPRGNSWDDVKSYEHYDATRKINTQYWPVGDYGMTVQNPYWINYRNLNENKKDRYTLGASLSYKLLDCLTLSGRVRLDNSYNDYTQKNYATTNDQLTAGSNRGYYNITKSSDKQIYADFLLSFNKVFGEDWSVQANFGGSISDMRYDDHATGGPIADGSDKFAGVPAGLANFFAVQNLSTPHVTNMQSGWREQTQSLYASADVGFKGTYYLTLTGRNDWPSALAGPNSVNSSFFYPSVGLSVLMNNFFPSASHIMPLWKIRGSFASVGSAFNRYIANPRYQWDSSTQSWSVLTQYPLYDLKPERTNSVEVGMNFRFLNDITFDATYYLANTANQTFNPELPVNQYSKIYIQTGSVRNWGMEFALSYSHTWGDFYWRSGLTYSFNRNKITELADNAVNPVTGEHFSMDILDMGGLGSTRFLLKTGGSMGDIYSTIDLRRDSNGNIYVDPTQSVVTSAIQDKEDYIKLGSVLPAGNLAWNNSFAYKNFGLSFMINARLGGKVFSRTQAVLDYYGVSQNSADARDKGFISLNNGDLVSPQMWYSVIAGGTAVPQYYIYDATNIRLGEVTFSYTIPRAWLRNVCDIKLSLVGRNLWMIYNKAPFDPESVATTDNWYQGIDYFMMPSLRNLGFNVNFTF
jgi:TonB-linked SusC/RagA family outer membrane protein